MSEYAIEMHKISKTYPGSKNGAEVIRALEHLSLCVPRGSIVSLMGGSGCGKSTVTKIISGIEGYDSGTLKINGTSYRSGQLKLDIKRKIGYVFQWHNLTQWRTVEGNLYFPLEMFGEKKTAEWKARANKYLELVGLAQYKNVFPRELSGGMKQRVGIARALMMEPEILVFDQPLGALDAMTRTTLMAMLNRIIREEGKTMLMVTSDLDEAVRYSDIIYVMEGPPGRIKERIITGIDESQRESADFEQSTPALEMKMRLTHAIYGYGT